MVSMNQVNNQPSLQKITLPTFSVANFGKPNQQDIEDQQTGTFKDKMMKNAIFSNFGGSQRKDQLILGMMDSGDLEIDSPGGAVIIGPPTLNAAQQVQWVRVPRPQQPNLVQKNAIGGGGKYASSSRTSNNAVTAPQRQHGNNQPTFPAFFTKTSKDQQMKTKNEAVEASDHKQLNSGSLTQMKQMNIQMDTPHGQDYKGTDGR